MLEDDDTTETTDEEPTATAETVADDGSAAASTDNEQPGDADSGSAAETPAPAASGGEQRGGADPQRDGGANDGVDVEAELAAKEKLADDLDAGVISHEEYAKAVTKHDRAIIKAQRELAKPAQEVKAERKQQEAAQRYWQEWGKGTDIAQKQFGKTIRPDRAAALFRESQAEVAANPRYHNRPEMNAESIIYNKWMDKMEAEKKKPGAATRATAPQTRVTGDTPVTQGAGGGQRRTAREKLDAGEYHIE